MTVPLSEIIGEQPGFGRALDTFRRAARDVPAYREFLADNGIDAESIRTSEHFTTVAPVTKTNYLRRYPRPALLWRGDVTGADAWSTSSGSSGKPTYWPRGRVAVEESVELYDRMFRHSFDSHQRSTLLVDGFAMGNWIGGTYTYRAGVELPRRGHRLSVIAPGIDAEAILADIAALGPDYDQVVLAGYPPFVQDVLDRADAAVLRQDLKILLAGESITEQWRDHMLDRIGAPGEPERICLIYGTADAGVMGHETATTIAIRRAAHADPRVAEALFGTDAVLPTFVEYDPHLRYAEVDGEGRFLFTIDSSLPLIRYRINDQGSIQTPWQVAEVLRRYGHRIPIRTSTLGAGFLALHGRSDVAASFYAVKLYPAHVLEALQEPGIHEVVTGKFVLATRTDEHFAQHLDLHVELRETAAPPAAFGPLLARRVVAALCRTNSEYRKLHAVLGTAAEPNISLEPHGSSRFRYDTKHRYLEGAA